MASVSSGVCFAAIAAFWTDFLIVLISVVTNQNKNKRAVLLEGGLHIWNVHLRNNPENSISR